MTLKQVIYIHRFDRQLLIIVEYMLCIQEYNRTKKSKKYEVPFSRVENAPVVWFYPISLFQVSLFCFQ